MSNPYTWNALKSVGLIPKDTRILEGNVNPALEITLKVAEDDTLYDKKEILKIKKSRIYNVG